MSILINMEMPKNGEYHMTLYVDSDSAYIDVESFPEDKDKFEVIQVPPHGRLIDADAAIQSLPPIEDYDFAELCTIDTAKRLIRKAFDMQPIVVQADKDGET